MIKKSAKGRDLVVASRNVSVAEICDNRRDEQDRSDYPFACHDGIGARQGADHAAQAEQVSKRESHAAHLGEIVIMKT